MNVVLSLAVAVLVGTGSYLLLKHDLVRLVIGMLLLSNGANLFIMASGLSRGSAPIYPLPESGAIADPLVQAMTLTAIVITFGVAALLLSLIYRVYLAHATLDTDTLAEAEEADEMLAELDAETGVDRGDASILARESHVA